MEVESEERDRKLQSSPQAEPASAPDAAATQNDGLRASLLAGPTSPQEQVDQLKSAHELLRTVKQRETSDELDELAEILSREDYLNSSSSEVRVLTACCLADVMRIFAPNAPFEDGGTLRTIFIFFIRQMRGIEDVDSPFWSWSYYLLEKLSLVQAFTLVADDEEVVEKAITSIYGALQDSHSYKVFTLLQNVLVTLVEETTQPVQQWLLDTLLRPLVSNQNDRSRELCVSVLRRCSTILQSAVSNFLNSLLAQDGMLNSDLKDHKKELIVGLNRVSSEFLLYVLPNLERELTSESKETRSGAVSMITRIFSEPESSAVKDYPTLLHGYIRRFTDVDSSIRRQATEELRSVLECHPSTADQLVPALKARTMDQDEEVRKAAVETTFALQPHVAPEALNKAAERMIDKSLSVRRAAIECVTKAFVKDGWPGAVNVLLLSARTLQSVGDSVSLALLSKLMFSDCLERNTKPDTETLVRNWLSMFAETTSENLDTLRELSASWIAGQNRLAEVFEGRRRHLSASQANNDQSVKTPSAAEDAASIEKMMATTKGSKPPAKQIRQILEVRDVEFYTCLCQLGNLKASWEETDRAYSKLLSIVEDEQDMVSFLKEELIPRYYRGLFSEEALRIVAGTALDRDRVHSVEMRDFAAWFLQSVAPLVPDAFESVSDVVADLLLEANNITVALELLSSIGEYFRIKTEKMSAVNEMLVKLALGDDLGACKLAAKALVRMHGDDLSIAVWNDLFDQINHKLQRKELESSELSEVVGALVTCSKFASRSRLLWDARKDQAVEFSMKLLQGELVVKVNTAGFSLQTMNTLKRRPEGLTRVCVSPAVSLIQKVDQETNFADCCTYAVRILARAAEAQGEELQTEDATFAEEVIRLLLRIIQKLGDVFDMCEGNEELSHENEQCAKVRLAAAKGVLRISRSLGTKDFFSLLKPSNFLITALSAQDANPDIRLAFAEKVYKSILHKRLQFRWIAALVFMAIDPDKQNMDTVRRYMGALIKTWKMKVDAFRKQSDGDDIRRVLSMLPESALPTIIWMLAHHPDMRIDSESGYTDSKRYLEFLFKNLLAQGDYASFMLQILQTVMASEDATDANDATDATDVTFGTKMIRAVADLAVQVLSDMQSGRKWDLTEYPGRLNLPEDLFRINRTNRGPKTTRRELYDATVGPREGATTEERPDGSGEHTGSRSRERSVGSDVIGNVHIDEDPNHGPAANEKPATQPETELIPKADSDTIAGRAAQRRRSRRSRGAEEEEEAGEPSRKTSRPSAEKSKRKSAPKAAPTVAGAPLKQVNKSSSLLDIEIASGERADKIGGVGQQSASEVTTAGGDAGVPKKARKSSASSGPDDNAGQTQVNQETKNEKSQPQEEDDGLPDTTRRTPQRNRKRPKRYDDNAEDLAMGSSKSSTGTVISRRGLAEAR